MNKSAVTNWKNRKTPPRDSTLMKIADYFGVSVNYLLTGKKEQQKESADTQPSDSLQAREEELNEYLEELKNNPGMRILFSKTKNASKEDIEKVIKMFDILRGDDDGRNYY